MLLYFHINLIQVSFDILTSSIFRGPHKSSYLTNVEYIQKP